MNKLAHFMNYHHAQGSQAALHDISTGMVKNAGVADRVLSKATPGISKRLRNLALGAGVLGGGAALYKSQQEEPSLLASMADGGKDMLSNLDPDTLAQYGALLGSLEGGGGYGLGYDASQLSPSDYSLEDLGYDPSMMGYEAAMSPSEESVYYDYNTDDSGYSDPFSSSGYDAGYGGGYGY